MGTERALGKNRLVGARERGKKYTAVQSQERNHGVHLGQSRKGCK